MLKKAATHLTYIKCYYERMRLILVAELTAFRVAAAVMIAAFLWPEQAWLAILVLMTVAFATDLFDGMLARRWRVVSRFGKIADPLADKIICLTVLWLLAMQYDSWLIAFGASLITVYDITTMTLRLSTMHTTKPVAAAHMVAKTKTSVLMLSLCLFVVDLLAGGRTFFFVTAALLLTLSCGMSLWSLREYFNFARSKSRAGA